MNILLQTQHYLSRRSRLTCTPLLAAMLLSATAYAGPAQPVVEKISTIKESARVNVTGTVKDDKGQPLPGVSVKIKGTNTGTSTDVNGTFRINLPTGNETLVFSFIGFKTKEVPAGGQTTINVTLAESTSELNEVVVVGYGTQKKAHLTGSVVDIKAAEIEDLPATNIGAALAGRLVGVGVSGGISRPGSTATLTIRGGNPFTGKESSNPVLYVIDDIIQLDGQGKPDQTLFNSLDPAEIESISVLKDAAAAVYGTRGGNGVVVVTTKRGKEGKPKINYSGSVALTDEAYRPKMMSAYEFGMYMNIMNGPNGGNITSANLIQNSFFSADELEHMKGLNYDWLDEAWKAAYQTNHNISLSGGAEKATYFANVSYNKQNGNLGTLDWDRWNFRAGTDVKLASNFKVGLQLSGNTQQLDKTFNKVSGEDDEDDYQSLLRAPRYIPMYIDGYPVHLPGNTNDLSAYHFEEIQRLNNLSETSYKTFTINANLEYQLPWVKGLKAKAIFARNLGGSNNSQIGTKYALYEFTRLGTNQHIYEGATMASSFQASNGNRIWHSNINRDNTQFNFMLNYDRTFGKHSFSALATVERSEGESTQEDVYKSDPIQSTNGMLLTAFGTVEGRTFHDEFGSLGYVARANYSYANKYLAELQFRSDASTKFAPANYWGNFYSGSFGWVISEENFFKVPAVDFLKLRYSTGLIGNDNTGAWLWRQRYTINEGKGAVFNDNAGASTGMKMEKSPSPDATWSKEFKNNLGIDAKFLNSRLSATVEGFYNKASDILIERTADVPVTIGGSVGAENYGKANFFGYEVDLGWNATAGKNIRYGINARYSWYDNKVIQMNFNDQEILRPWIAQPGKSSDNGKWGYDYLGIFKNQEEINAYVNQYGIKEVFSQVVTTSNPTQLRPGMMYYRDVRGALQPDGTFAGPDGIINENDQILLAKRASSHHSFGVTLKGGYKSLNFDVVIGGSFGGWAEIDHNDQLNASIARNYYSLPSIWGNIYDPQLNPSGTMPNPYSKNMYSVTSDFWRVSAFRMRMTSFNVNYTLPQKWVNPLKINSARVYLTGLNPFNFYNPYSYRDVDKSWDQYPNLRTFSFGLNIGL